MKLHSKMPKAIRIILAVLIALSIAAGYLYISKNPLVFYDANHSYTVKDAGPKIVFIIPGAGETEDKFASIESFYRDVGITPVFINVDWRFTRISDFVRSGSEEIARAYTLYTGRDIYFFGFSFGAAVALSNAEKYQSKGTILCSLSPIFQGDIPMSGDPVKIISSLMNFKFPEYQKIPEETTVFLYGDHDNRMIISLKDKRKSIYPNSDFEIVPGARHDITGAAYREKIKQEIYELKESNRK